MSEQPAKPRSKRMVGFYVGMGMVLALAVAFYFAWTPLRARYIEYTITLDRAWYSLQDPRVERARELLSLGPVAEPSVRRLLTDDRTRYLVPAAMKDARHFWALPLMIEMIETSSDLQFTAAGPLSAVMRTAGAEESRRDFILPSEIASSAAGIENQDCAQIFDPASGQYVTVRRAHLAVIRERVLVWWHREGKAKYGRGEE